jgi:1-acyl-sn-glycerol-3-phosphate acyltransferase
MGIALGLYSAARLARYTLPTFADAMTGRLTREMVDQRCRDFGDDVVHSARIHLEIRGRELVPRGRAFVYMSNHQSHDDIPVTRHILPKGASSMVPGQPVRVTFGAPIATERRPIDELMAEVRDFLVSRVSSDL